MSSTKFTLSFEERDTLAIVIGKMGLLLTTSFFFEEPISKKDEVEVYKLTRRANEILFPTKKEED